jgi:hypothetical protein
MGGGGDTKIQNQTNPQQMALAEIAQNKYDAYKDTFKPIENKYIKQVQGFNSQDLKNQATGMAATSVADRYGDMTSKAGESLGGGRMMAEDYASKAADTAGATSQANQGVTNRYLTAKQGLVSLGNGQSGSVVQGLGSLANQSVLGQQRNIENQSNLNIANQQSLGTAAGMTAAGLGKGVKLI